MTDPIQQLIDAGAIPSAPYVPQSRYYGVAIALLPQTPPRDPIPYVRRRFIDTAWVGLAGTHVVAQQDRPDLLAARYFGEPLLDWRIADANVVMDPDQLVATPGARIAIPLLQGG